MSLEEHHNFILQTMQRHDDIARKFIAELEAENASLKAKVERLIKAGDDLASDVGNSYESQLSCVQGWNAAKEGKQS